MLDYLQKCILHFIETQEWLDKNNAIWLSVPAYHDLRPKHESYDESSQWNVKEMKEMSWYLPRVATQTLRGSSPAQCPILNHAIECIQALLEFYMYARYKSHDDATLSYLEDAMGRFYTFKDVFLLRLVGKIVQAEANALRLILMKKWKIDEETNAETWTLSKRPHELNAWRDYISDELDVSKEFDADYNFPKIHVMSH